MAIKACAICPFNFYIIIIFYKNIYKNIIQKKYIYTKKIIYNKGKGQRAKRQREIYLYLNNIRPNADTNIVGGWNRGIIGIYPFI